MVVLDAIHYIQAQHANDLACRWNCKAGKCGSCSAEVNGKPMIAGFFGVSGGFLLVPTLVVQSGRRPLYVKASTRSAAKLFPGTRVGRSTLYVGARMAEVKAQLNRPSGGRIRPCRR
jgi:2Fe-2S iron-sulfur cluster binding domain